MLAVFTLLVAAVFSAIAHFYRVNAYTIAQTQQLQIARHGVERMVRDLREMAYADNGAYPLVAMSSSSIQFYSDVDRDEQIEKISYTLESAQLMRRVFNASGTPPVYESTPSREETVSGFVQNNPMDVPLFTYYDAAGNPLPASGAVTDVRLVDVRLVVNVDLARNPNEFLLRSSAALRNVSE